MTAKQRGAGFSLHRREAEAAVAVVRKDELGVGRAQHAFCVEKDDRVIVSHR